MLSLSSDFQVVDSHAKNIKIMDSWKAHAWAAKIINSKIAINLKLQSWWYCHSDYKWWNDFSPSTVYTSVSQPLKGWGATSDNIEVQLSNGQNMATFNLKMLIHLIYLIEHLKNDGGSLVFFRPVVGVIIKAAWLNYWSYQFLQQW